MRLLIMLLVLFVLSCKYDQQKEIIDDSIKHARIINFSFRGMIKDTLIIPNIKYTKYRPVVTYTTNLNPYLDCVLIEDSKSKKDTIKIECDNEIIVRHNYRLEDIYYVFKAGDSVIYESINGFPIYRILNKKKKNYQDLKYEAKKRKYLGQKEPRNFNYFQFSKLMAAVNPKEELENYFNILNSEFQYETKLLDSLYYNKKISKEFYNIQNQKIKFDRYNIILASPKGNGFYLENKESLRREIISDTLLKFAFFKNFLKKAAYFETVHFNKEKVSNDMVYSFILNSDLFLTQSKNYLLYEYLQNISENLSQKDFLKYYNLFLENEKSSYLINDIKNKYLLDFDKLKRTSNDSYFINFQKEEITFQKFMNMNKNKLIYIDFWASWCAPCRSAIPASKKLHEDYSNKDVVFLYISIDKNIEKWKKALEEEGLLFTKNSFLAINYPTANFYKDLNLKTIPRYLLYNKKGELIHQNAPAPNSKEIRKLFNKYLNQ